MSFVRRVGPVLVAGLLCAAPLLAQESSGAITGKVVDATTQQPIGNVEVSIPGTNFRTSSGNDGGFLLNRVPAGTYNVRAGRIGYGIQLQSATVTAGGTATVQFALQPAAAVLEPVVVTGYGSQRREAITGSVSTVEGSTANVGVVTNVDQMVRGRAAGVEVTQNNGEPGAGAHILIRGGSSVSNTNEPLYVIDGVPVYNAPDQPGGIGVGGAPALPRNPLNMLDPSDIASITVLKDASATAIYGSRAANGVILVETRKGGTVGGGPAIEYDSYVAAASPAKTLDVLNGTQFSSFVTGQVSLYTQDSINGVPQAQRRGLSPNHLAALGPANTNWEQAVTRTAVTHNHDISFNGGSQDTRYRASLNYMNQEGVAISNGLERVQGRLSGTHNDLDNRLRLSVNIATSRVKNQYISTENTGGFEGGVFQNVAIFNPTQPISVTDSTGTHYYETGSSSVRNPVALATQLQDIGTTLRTIGNATAEFDFLPGVTGQVTLGVDHSSGDRQIYFPKINPVGALTNGLAQQSTHVNSTITLQTLMTIRRQLAESHSLDVVAGYEYSKFDSTGFSAQGQGFSSDATGFNGLGFATSRTIGSSSGEDVLASFLSRVNYGFKDKFFVTGVLRYDGSSKFATGHQWALFPALSASWHLSQEEFMHGGPFSDLRLRAGIGRQGNPGIPPYQQFVQFDCSSGSVYPWGDTPNNGCSPSTNGNPNLKWEITTQIDVGADFGLMSNRLAGTVEWYNKNTKDLLFVVPASQPANNSTTLQNIGKLRNRGFEASLDAVLASRPGLTWRTSLVFAAERNKMIEMPGTISTGNVSGQGQSNQVSQLISVGQPLGTFYGPVYLGTDATGKQVFSCSSATPGCVSGKTTLGVGPDASDYRIIGNANPKFTVGLHSGLIWKKFDISFLLRASVGADVFNNTALVYSTKGNALQDKNFLATALSDPIGIHEPAIFSSKWVENASYLRMQNITVQYDLDLPVLTRSARTARVYVSADNLFTITGYSGLDPEVSNLESGLSPSSGLAARGIDYLTYPRPRTITGGLRLTF